MEPQNTLGVPINHQSISQHRNTYASKKANNWKWLKEWVDYYCDQLSYVDPDLLDKDLLNYRLWNARGVYKTDVSSPFVNEQFEEEGYYFSNEDIPHFDIITPIAKSLLGQQQLMPFKPIVTDSSSDNVNYRKKKKLELLQDWLNQTYIQPSKQEAIQMWMRENNIQDPSQLPPEMQEQFQQETQQKSEALLPKDIDRYMASDYKSPRETLLQRITEFTLRRDKLKFWTDENFKHLLITGREIFETGIKHNKAFTRIVNPVNYISGGPSDALFEEDMDWQVYKEDISLSTLFKDHGHEITEKDITKLKEFDPSNNNNITRTRGEFPEPMATKVAQFDAETGFFDNLPNMKSKEGQSVLLSLYQKFGNIDPNDTLFTRTTVVFKSLRKFKLVTRYNAENNEYSEEWVDGSYERNLKKDLYVSTHWFPHAYMGRRVEYGASDSYLYFDLGPVPNQYKNMLEPWNIKMPFMGIKFSKLFNNTENVAPLDLAKPWQDKFNIKLAIISEKEATDIGKIITVADTLKPEGWTYFQWLRMAKMGKILPLNTSNELMNGVDPQMFKQYDLTQLNEIAAHLQQLDWIRSQAALAMNYNPQRLGQIVPTEAVRNSQQNIQQSTYQTQDLFTLHNECVERVLNRHIDNEKLALTNNSYIASYVLDDMSIAELEVDPEIIDSAEIGVVLRNSSEDFNNLREIKMDSQAMIQNGMISFPEYIRLKMANNMSDALNIAERAEEKMMKRQQENAQQQADQAKQIEEIKQQWQLKLIELGNSQKQLDRESNEFRDKLKAMMMANQMDIDKDGRSDLIQIEELKQKDKQRDRDLEKESTDKKLKTEIEKTKIMANSRNNSK
jgi:hypothetical protein